MEAERDTQTQEVWSHDRRRAAGRSQGRRGGGRDVFHSEVHHRGKVRRCAISEDTPGNGRRTARRSRSHRPSARRRWTPWPRIEPTEIAKTYW